MVAAVIAFSALARSDHELDVAHSEQLSTVSASQRDSSPDVSALAAAAAWQRSPSNETRDLLLQAATNSLMGKFSATPGNVAVSPDNKVLAVSGGTAETTPPGPVGGVTLWDIAARRTLAIIGNANGSGIIAFGPETTSHFERLAIAEEGGSGSSGAVALYQGIGSSYSRTEVLPFSADLIAFSTNKILALATSQDSGTDNILLFREKSGTYQRAPFRVIKNAGPVASMSFGPDGGLAVGTTDNKAYLYTSSNGYSISEITTAGRPGPAPSGPPKLCVVNLGPDNVISVTSNSGTLTFRRSGKSPTQTQAIDAASGLSDAAYGQGVLATADSASVTIYAINRSVDRYEAVAAIPGGTNIASMAFSPDGSLLAVDEAGTIGVYNTRLLSGDLHHASRYNNARLEFDPVNPAVLAVSDPKGLALLNVTTNSLKPIPGAANAIPLAFGPDGTLAALDKQVILFPDPVHDPARKEVVPGTARTQQVVFGSDGTMAVICCDPSSSENLRIYPPHNVSKAISIPLDVRDEASHPDIDGIAFGPAGQLAVALNYEDGHSGVAVLLPPSYRESRFIHDPDLTAANLSQDIAFAPDGTLAIGGNDRIRIYPRSPYVQFREIVGPTLLEGSGYAWLAFSPNGILISLNSAVGVELWDYVTGQNIATFGGPMNQIGGEFALSTGGRFLGYETFDQVIAPNGDGGGIFGTITLWRTPYLDRDGSDGVNYLCSQLESAPTIAHWQQYFPSDIPYPRTCHTGAKL